MRKTRTIVALTLLATALCADRAAVAAAEQGQKIEAGEVTRGFARRLTVSLRRVVPAVQLHQGRMEFGGSISGQLPAIAAQDAGRSMQVTPFQFRLPPPSL